MPESKQSLLAKLNERRSQLVDAWAKMIEDREVERAEFEGRENTSDEDVAAFKAAEDKFRSASELREAEIKELDERVRQHSEIAERRANAAEASKGTVASVVSEPKTYRKDNAANTSYFRDLAIAQVPGVAGRMEDPAGAMERLQRHAREMNEELPKRERSREVRAEQQIEKAERDFSGSIAGATQRRGFDSSPFERRVNPNRTDGQGGYFVPPIWLIDEYIPALRAGRVAAGLCRQMELPEGTDSINIPKLSTTTLTAVQTADGAGVTSQDFTDTSVSAGVKTIAGQEDVAIQLIEQSPGQIIDRVVMEDLLADYNKQLDIQVIQGTGSNNQVTGLLPAANWSGANTVTYTSSNQSGLSFNQAVGAATSKIAYTRYDLTNVAALLHPRRWFWFATSTDAVPGASALNARPLVNRQDVAYNVGAVERDPAVFQGLVGHFPFGVDTYIDGNMPIIATAAGAVSGGSNDIGLVAKWDDAWLFEGNLRTRVLPEILSGTLQIRFQVFNYFAFLVRYGQSIAVIIGTGLAAPTSAFDTSITY